MIYMGIFSFRGYGPGRGVRKDERKLKRPFLLFYYLFFNFTKFIKTSMLFTVVCLPVITIGPAICGMTYINYCIAEDKPSFFLSDFFEHFRKNFFKGLFAFIITLIPLFSYTVALFNAEAIPHFKNFLMPLLLVNLIMLMMSFYIYPLIVFYDIPFFAVFKNALLFALIKLPLNLLVAAVILGLITVTFYYIPVIGMIVTPLFLISFLNYFSTFSVWPTIKKYMEV